MKTKLNILIILSAIIISFIACRTTSYINSRDIIYGEWKTANYTFIIDSIANEKGLTFYPINYRKAGYLMAEWGVNRDIFDILARTIGEELNHGKSSIDMIADELYDISNDPDYKFKLISLEDKLVIVLSK